MEALVPLILFIVFAPITLSIIALVKVSQTRTELHQLRSRIQSLPDRERKEHADVPRPAAAPAAPKATTPKSAQPQPRAG